MSQIQSYQKMLPSLGIKYVGPTDGIASPEFIRAMQSLEEILQAKSGEPMIGKLWSAGNVLMPLGDMLGKFFPSKTAPKEEIKEDLVPSSELAKPDAPKKISNQDVLLFQKLFKEMGWYAGATDGMMNQELISSAKLVEDYISGEINKSARGLIIQGDSFQTTVEDVRRAIELVKNKKKQASRLERQERFVSLAALLNK